MLAAISALGLILHGVVLGSLLEHRRQKSEDRYSVLLRSRDCECDAPALKANKPLSAMRLGFGFFTENILDTFGLSRSAVDKFNQEKTPQI